jgi:large subunit ribosomal protein L10
MAKSRAKKEELLKEYKDTLTNNAGYIIVRSDNIDTATLSELKQQLKEIDANFTVIKNTVFKIALEEVKQPLETKDFTGASAIITFNEDPTAPAKLIKKIQTEMELLDPRFGVVDSNYISGGKIMELADIPSRPELYAKLLGSLNAPLGGFMNAVTGNVRGFTQAIHSLSEK